MRAHLRVTHPYAQILNCWEWVWDSVQHWEWGWGRGSARIVIILFLSPLICSGIIYARSNKRTWPTVEVVRSSVTFNRSSSTLMFKTINFFFFFFLTKCHSMPRVSVSVCHVPVRCYDRVCLFSVPVHQCRLAHAIIINVIN
jgi:hypothetical protein